MLNSNQTNTASEINSRNDYSLNHPIEDGDVYSFQDTGHFFSYYTDLQELYEEDLQAFDIAVHEGRTIPTVYNMIRFDSFYNESDMYKPFLSDPIMQSFANEHFEFKIGNSLVTYANNEVVLLSDAGNPTTTAALRELPKGDRINADQLPANVSWGADTDKNSFLGSWCGCSVNIELIGCTDVRIWGECRNAAFGYGDGTVTVRFYDRAPRDRDNPVGSPDSWFWDEVDIPVNGTFDITQEAGWYLNRGPNGGGLNQVHVRIWVSSDCASGGNAAYEDIWVSLPAPGVTRCDPKEEETEWTFYTIGGQDRHGFVHITKFFRSWTGVDVVEAEVHSKWKEYPWSQYTRDEWSDLWANIDEDRRGDNCNVQGGDNKALSCNTCDHLRVRETDFLAGVNAPLVTNHCTGDVTGSFRKDYVLNGQEYSMDEESDIIFNCCEF